MSLHRGIVASREDPTGRGRVQVDVPAIGASQWAELMIPLGTAAEVATPEVGAAVWVMYEGDGFTDPVVVGRMRDDSVT